MKKTLISIVILFSAGCLLAQKPPVKHGKCGLTNPKSIYMQDAETFLKARMSERADDPQAFTTPYLVKIFVRIFRNNDGTNAATTRENVIARISQMNGQYSGDNVCFLLVGIDEINDTYANIQMNDDDATDSDYKPYLRDNYALPGVITIFVHDQWVASGSSGNAFDIPNNFLSIAGWAANSTTVNSIYGHEMGHCLGLYHTFQRWNGVQEHVTRSSGNSCYNCFMQGDFCCDTPADYADSDQDMNSVSCTYTGTRVDECNDAYNPSTRNIMSYSPWACISTTSTAITANQATRVHATINDALGPVYSTIAPDNQTITSSETRSGNVIRGVRGDLIYNAASVVHQGSVRSFNAAGNSVTLNPGVHFVPNANGEVGVRVQAICQ